MAKEESDDKLLRRKGVASLLGISRGQLGRIIERDPSFPKFIELAPGISLARAREVRAWLRRKELAAYEAGEPGRAKRAKRAVRHGGSSTENC
jgi:predicted DNA-binding transcriptional regulator AlpA